MYFSLVPSFFIWPTFSLSFISVSLMHPHLCIHVHCTVHMFINIFLQFYMLLWHTHTHTHDTTVRKIKILSQKEGLAGKSACCKFWGPNTHNNIVRKWKLPTSLILWPPHTSGGGVAPPLPKSNPKAISIFSEICLGTTLGLFSSFFPC